MNEHSPANVIAAHELLLEELEGEIDWVNQSGGKAFVAGDHERAKAMLERAQKLSELHRDIRALGSRLGALVQAKPGGTSEVRAHLAKGLKTPQDAYRVPILRALADLGGSADLSVVLDRVYAVMKAKLNKHDLAPLPSDKDTQRWRNTAQWCRNAMREEGLIKEVSDRGVWEISEAGRKWLASHGNA